MSEDIELLLSFSKMFDRISNAEVIQQDKEKILTDFLKAYYSDMYEIEKLHLGDEFDKADKKSCINFKRKIFEKYLLQKLKVFFQNFCVLNVSRVDF